MTDFYPPRCIWLRILSTASMILSSPRLEVLVGQPWKLNARAINPSPPAGATSTPTWSSIDLRLSWDIFSTCGPNTRDPPSYLAPPTNNLLRPPEYTEGGAAWRCISSGHRSRRTVGMGICRRVVGTDHIDTRPQRISLKLASCKWKTPEH